VPGAAICQSAAEYEQTVGALTRLISGSVAVAGDPKRAAEILARVVKRQNLPTHLVLGAGAVQMAQDHSRAQAEEAATWEAVSRSADFGRDYPVDLPTE
jgi:hypothetical protein